MTRKRTRRPLTPKRAQAIFRQGLRDVGLEPLEWRPGMCVAVASIEKFLAGIPLETLDLGDFMPDDYETETNKERERLLALLRDIVDGLDQDHILITDLNWIEAQRVTAQERHQLYVAMATAIRKECLR